MTTFSAAGISQFGSPDEVWEGRRETRDAPLFWEIDAHSSYPIPV